MAQVPTSAPLSQLLSACAVELAALASLCSGLQDVLSPTSPQTAIEDGQAFDLVTQTLAALSQYITAIAADAPRDWTLDPVAAAAALPLAGLADRLTGIASGVETDGDLYLFEAAP